MNTETNTARKLSTLIPGATIQHGVPEEVVIASGISLRVFRDGIELRNNGTYETLAKGLTYAQIAAYATAVAGLGKGETMASTGRVYGPRDAQRAA